MMHALAFLLLLQPGFPLPGPEQMPPPREPGPPPAWWPLVRWPLTAAWIEAEVMDPEERGWFFCNPEELFRDARIMQERAIELRNCPPLSDAIRFPNKKIGNASCMLNYRCAESLRLLRDLYPWNQQINRNLYECARRYAIWDAARDAQCSYYRMPQRRRSLRTLRELLGPEAYYRGEMPDPIP